MMAGGIAHEINNPLAVIHGAAANISRMAESGSVPVGAVLKNSHRIMQTADRISRIVRSLRHVAREGSADEFRETPVRQITEETLELCAERFRVHNIRFGRFSNRSGGGHQLPRNTDLPGASEPVAERV
jgi:C4-dicarboxylate-specific signal transduction histidine kinase